MYGLRYASTTAVAHCLPYRVDIVVANGPQYVEMRSIYIHMLVLRISFVV